jgi:hypothetical protein
LLQLAVDTLGLHSWHAALGFVAPAAQYAPPIQHPAWHCPLALQINPEPQELPPGSSGWVQVPDASHTSWVHALLSLVQLEPEGCLASAGHAVLVPVQFSATSHTPAEARHTVLEGCLASAGQAALVPVHISATSHTPADARHCTVLAAYPSVGQLSLVPVHVSATSHTPAEARHTVLEDCLASAGHAALVPVHVSATSHTPPEARHSVPEDL